MDFKKTTLIILFFVTLGLMLFGCSTGQPAEEPTPTPLPTPVVPRKPTYEVQIGDVISQLQFTGRISPVSEESLFFRSSGRIRKVYVEKGDQITTGQVIADLDYLDDLERQLSLDNLRLRRAEIDLRNSELNLILFELSLGDPDLLKAQAEQAVAAAKKKASEAERAYQNTLKTATQADIDAAYAKLLLAEDGLNQAKEQFAPYSNKPDNNLTKANLQTRLSEAQQLFDAAARQYNSLTSASNEIDQLIAESELTLAVVELEKAENTLARLQENTWPAGYDEEYELRKNSVELAQISLEETKLQIQDLEANIADARIIAPFDGEVLSISLTEGRTVEAFKAMVVVGNMSAMEVSASLTSQDMAELEEGMIATLALANRPGETISGVIRRLPFPYGGGGAASDVEDVDTSVRISLDTSAEEVGLKLGDLMRVTVILESRQDALWLPPQALRTFEGRRFVVVQEGEFQQRIDVKLGIEGNDRVEILEGVEAGQIVIGP